MLYNAQIVRFSAHLFMRTARNILIHSAILKILPQCGTLVYHRYDQKINKGDNSRETHG